MEDRPMDGQVVEVIFLDTRTNEYGTYQDEGDMVLFDSGNLGTFQSIDDDEDADIWWE